MALSRGKAPKRVTAIKPDPAIKAKEKATITELLRLQRESQAARDSAEQFAENAAAQTYKSVTASAAAIAAREEIVILHDRILALTHRCEAASVAAAAHKNQAREYLRECAEAVS